MSREAMKQALEALESDPISHAGLVSRKQAITALRQALEEKQDISAYHGWVLREVLFDNGEPVGHREPEQEPVAWASSLDFDDDDQEIIPAKDKGKLGTNNCDIPLYAAPPKKEWVGLTLNEAEDFYEKYTDRAELINAIDKFLEEKNHG